MKLFVNLSGTPTVKSEEGVENWLSVSSDEVATRLEALSGNAALRNW